MAIGKNVEVAVCRAIAEINRSKNRESLEVLRDHQLTADLGLTSMDQVRLMELLEKEFFVNPIYHGDVFLTERTTVGELCEIYEAALLNGKSK